MSSDKNLDELASRFGILPAYQDFGGKKITTSRETKKALLQANGLSLDNDKMIGEICQELNDQYQSRLIASEINVESGCETKITTGQISKWHIKLEEGAQGHIQKDIEGSGTKEVIIPPLPSGIHELHTIIAGQSHNGVIIAAPIRTPLIGSNAQASKIWGINAALYGLRSKRGRGLGDFQDLAHLCDISGSAGADFLGINPVHSLGYADMLTFSPYSPSNRGFLNIEHIALDQIPGLIELPNTAAILDGPHDGPKEHQMSSVNCEMIDYRRHRKFHHQQLEQLFDEFCTHSSPATQSMLREFRRSRGEHLEKFALFEAISEVHGADWRRWPRGLGTHEYKAIREVKLQLSARISFHCWLQWIADYQLGQAQFHATNSGMAQGLYLDLAVGSRRGGAESWCEIDCVAQNVSLGAPPDQLNPKGQNWDLTAFAPQKLMANKYKALRQTYREAMRHCSILRIDHALGLNRSFWIPDDGSGGGYIKQPFRQLLAIIAMEAEVADCIIIGEDLGLVPNDFRQMMQDKGIYGYSVLQFEKDNLGQFINPSELRPHSLACFGTHDTPTLKGYWCGEDIDLWQSIELIDVQKAKKAREQRNKDLRALTAMGVQKSGDDLPLAMAEEQSFYTFYQTVHSALAGCSAAMVSVQLDDILGQVEAQNYPGTIDECPNWQRRVSKTLEEIEKSTRLADIGACMVRNGRGLKNPKQQEK